MNVYQKLQKIKLELLNCKIKKSGENKFAGFKYYELSDFLPHIIELCQRCGACTVFNFGKEEAVLKFIDSEAENAVISISSPLEKLEIRGSNVIQALGGVQTYIRRYLYMAMFDIVENDTFDALSGKKEEQKKYLCVDCKSEFKPFTSKENKYYNAGQVYHMAQSKSPDKKARCKSCREKLNLEEVKNEHSKI